MVTKKLLCGTYSIDFLDLKVIFISETFPYLVGKDLYNHANTLETSGMPLSSVTR